MKMIGLTGGSGAGKSAAGACFSALGAGVVDADAVYRELCDSCPAMLRELEAAFSGVCPAGRLDRRALAAIVFADPDALARLSRLTTPYIERAAQQKFAALGARALYLFDAPTLFQTGLDRACARVIAVTADEDTRVSRIIDRDGLTRAEALARIHAQPDEAFYREKGCLMLENNGDLAALAEKAAQIMQILTKGV